MQELSGKLALVTGAGSGIGRATVLELARAGCSVIAADIVEPTALATAQAAERLGVSAAAFAVDVADTAAMERFAEAVREKHGVPDIVVNNAGIGVSGPFLQTSVDDWQRLIGVNLWGVIHGSRLFGAQMVARGQGGHIVNVASAAAFHPSRELPAYAATKSAVLMLSECLRVELRRHGIGVTAVCPGLVNTAIVGSTRYVGVDSVTVARREAALRLYERRNYTPERAARKIVVAIRRNQAVAPVTVEAHALRLVGRLFPGVARTLARFQLAASR